MLQLVFFIYSLNSVVANFASKQESFGLSFFLLYGLEVAILGVYAILWQQIIKKFELSIAYANKAVVLIWAMIFGSQYQQSPEKSRQVRRSLKTHFRKS